MLKRELVKEVSRRSGYAQYVCKELLDEIFQTIFEELEGHGFVRIPGFGTFYTKERTGRIYHNSITNEINEIETRSYPKFKASDKLKESVTKTVFYRNQKL